MYQIYCKVISTKNMNIHQRIFKNYPDPTYLVKLRTLNRPLIEFRDSATDNLMGLVVLNKVKRSIKLCLAIVDVAYKNVNVGQAMLKVVLSMFNDDFNDADILYTVCPHQFKTDNYQELLLKSGFQLTTIKANGDLVYIYAKSI